MVALSALLLASATSFSNTTNSPTPAKALVARAGRPCSAQLTCPTDNGCTAKSVKGDEYLVTCHVDFYGGDLHLTQTPTLEKCLDACSHTDFCIGLSYKAKNCYLKKEITSNVDGHGVRSSYPFHDACPPADVSSYCHTHTGNTGDMGCYSTTETTPDYVVLCARDFYGGDLAFNSLVDLRTCIQACRGLGKELCKGVSWVQGGDEWGFCYLKETLRAAIYDERAVGAIIV